MARSLEELQAEALNLSRPERAQLAEVLISSLDEDAEIEQAWYEEIQRRVTELREGKVDAIPAKEVFSSIRERLRD